MDKIYMKFFIYLTLFHNFHILKFTLLYMLLNKFLRIFKEALLCTKLVEVMNSS